MKVLVCVSSLTLGGTGLQTLALVKALKSAKHDVLVTCYFEFHPYMTKCFEDAGCKMYYFTNDGHRLKGIMSTAAFLYKKLRKVVLEYRPDVAHVQYMFPGAIPILILRALGVRKILATAHTAADIYSSLRAIHFLQRHILLAFICITERAELSFFGSSQLYTPFYRLGKKNHFTIYNCLSEYIQIADETRQMGKEVTIGVVSRLEIIKGMDMIIPVFSLIHKDYPSTRLVVVGDGSLKQSLEHQVSSGDLQPAVTFAGRQPQERLQDYYDQIDILLMPSRSEGFGLTAIEAMARGCVVVAANVGGLPEVVENEVSGMLHKSEDIDDIAKKVTYIIERPSQFVKMSEAAIHTASKYSVKLYNEQIANLYQKL